MTDNKTKKQTIFCIEHIQNTSDSDRTGCIRLLTVKSSKMILNPVKVRHFHVMLSIINMITMIIINETVIQFYIKLSASRIHLDLPLLKSQLELQL
jgi:hypothetical protein